MLTMKMKWYAGLLVAFAVPPQTAAQKIEGARGSALDRCRENPNRYQRHCEVRTFTIPHRSPLVVAGGINGDVTVHAWGDTLIQVVATLRAEALIASTARDLTGSVQIYAGDNELKAEGPPIAGTSSWSVSYELWVPERTDLRVSSLNGSLSVDGVNGTIDLESTNGTLSLSNVNGDVQAHTANGGLSFSFGGDRWIGVGLHATSLNGPVQVAFSPGYSAALAVSTVTGRLTSDLGTSEHSDSRMLAKRLGRGGPPLRISTVNGAVLVHLK